MASKIIQTCDVHFARPLPCVVCDPPIEREPVGRGFKTSNEYAALLPFFRDIPKAVLAAIAVSALTSGGEQADRAAQRVANEWLILHQNGIVPQRPSSEIVALAKEAK